LHGARVGLDCQVARDPGHLDGAGIGLDRDRELARHLDPVVVSQRKTVQPPRHSSASASRKLAVDDAPLGRCSSVTQCVVWRTVMLSASVATIRTLPASEIDNELVDGLGDRVLLGLLAVEQTC
jgi:hypothetical protein